MTSYPSEAAVIDIIVTQLREHDSKAKVTFFSDVQGSSTVERLATFKAVIGLENSESIVNGMCDIGSSTDRRISYKGSQTDPTGEGEVRYLFFEAKINPFEE